MNCLGCKSDEYFYKNDTLDCIKKDEFKKKNNLEFTRLSSENFYIFICVLLVAIVIFVINCIFCKIKEKTRTYKRK